MNSRSEVPGINTSEFWFSIFAALGSLVAPIVALLVLRGIVTGDEAQLWVTIGGGLLEIAGMIVAGLIVSTYTKARTSLKGGYPFLN